MLLNQNGFHDIPSGKVAAVATFLEMTSRPERCPAPERPDLSLAALDRADLAGYRDLYRRVGADWLWFSRLLLTDAALGTILADPAVEVHALCQDGCPIGILELDGRVAGEVELAFFGLVPEAVRQGAGRWLMDRAIELAFARQPRRFWLHTCTLDHPAALGFYIRSGFRPYKLAIEIDDDPRLTGHLARTAAPQVPVIG